MNGNVLLWVLLFVAWIFVGTYWYACPIWENCGDDATENMDSASTAANDNATAGLSIGKDLPKGVINFTWGQALPQVSGKFQALKDSLQSQLKQYQVLEIAGSYFGKEPNGPQLGLDRAGEVRDLFVQGGFDSTLIRIKAMLREGAFDSISSEFSAIRFNINYESDRIQELEGKDFLIFFPFASNTKGQDPVYDIKLDEVATYLKESQKNVVLTGHTDAVGVPERNKKLGLDRANSIRDELTKRGVNFSQIDTRSKGDTDLLNPDDVSAAENRRVEVRFPN
jgi:hypothetical protein